MATMTPTCNALSCVPLFASLSPKQLKAIEATMKEMRFSAGTTVTEQGSADARFHVILEGTARAIVNGRARTTMNAGDYFGEISVLDGQGRSATVVADTDLVTMSAAPWNFKSMLREDPPIAIKLLEQLCGRLRSLEKNLV
jgi:CRP/FNR family cyclic AMP-dependent transcriptional regulator